MAWEQIIGQTTILGMLQRAILQNRIPQALLLTGDAGCGSLAIAVAFARVVNCETPVQSATQYDACGTCHSCIQARALQHPNMKFVIALPSGKIDSEDDLPAAVVEELKQAISTIAEDPYDEFRLAKATQIKIGQVRTLKKSLSLSSAQGGRRVVVIHRCEEMTQGAANALLKTLEEPHADVTFILTSAKPEQLLPTIVSRCQEVIVPPLDDDEIINALVQEQRCTKEEASLIAPFAEGSLSAARDFLGEDLTTERQEAVELLRASLRGRMHRVAISSAVNQIASSRDKNQAIRAVSLLALWLRDAHLVQVAGRDAAIINVDQRDPLDRFATGFPTADIRSVQTILEDAVRDIHRNVSITLILTTAMLEARKIILKGRHA